ncbi:GNAT family N-acetyltransferase [Sphingomonas sp.]|uniref:GNAT family N-acetyltransferase n=1 Tax=Sphingomonas sp. TaxID=28214 RepID=UPI0025FE78EC|nr:GNAT family N-acetyltransferase [Sphingomonas sp.]
MRIRPFQLGDEARLAALFHAAIHQVAAQYYSQDQVNAWAPQLPDPARFLARGTDGRTLFVAVDDADEPLAYGDVETDGHIDHLFCLPDVAGAGVTTKLYNALEGVARKHGISMLFTEASEPAKRFFAKQGFEVIERRDFEVNGVPIHNYRMEKRLSPVPR